MERTINKYKLKFTTMNTMTRIRRFEILEKCKVWQNEFPNMSYKDCFFALYDDRNIDGKELEYLIDWTTL